MNTPDRLVPALQNARADGTGVVVAALARLVADVGRGLAPAARTRWEGVRLPARVAARAAP